MFSVDIFLNLMGVGKTKGGGSRVMMSCPLAQWTHSKGEDKNPSANITTNHQIPLFKCFTCHEKGNVFTLGKRYLELSGDSRPLDYVRQNFGSTNIVKNQSYEDIVKQRAASVAFRLKKAKERSDMNESVHEKYDRFMKEIPIYAAERGLTKSDIIKWDLGYDRRKDRLIFTIKDYLGNICGFSGRALSEDQVPKYYHYPGLQKNLVFYGENFLNRDSKRVYIVEGFFDVIGLTKLGVKNVFATMGTSLSEDHLRNITRWFTEVVFIPDGDIEGLKFAESAGVQALMKIKKVGIAGVISNPKYEKRKRPDKWEESDFMFMLAMPLLNRDPSDLSKDEFVEVMNNLHWIDINNI